MAYKCEKCHSKRTELRDRKNKQSGLWENYWYCYSCDDKTEIDWIQERQDRVDQEKASVSQIGHTWQYKNGSWGWYKPEDDSGAVLSIPKGNGPVIKFDSRD